MSQQAGDFRKSITWPMEALLFDLLAHGKEAVRGTTEGTRGGGRLFERART